jgi:hypothetical protein
MPVPDSFRRPRTGSSLDGSRIGVFVGALRDDYTKLTYQHGASALTQHITTGTSRTSSPDRMSHVLGAESQARPVIVCPLPGNRPLDEPVVTGA